jgi:hypothetical protein
MIAGKMTGDYEYHHEFRGTLNQNVAQNQTYTWATQLDLSRGLWIIQLFIEFSLHNLNIQTEMIAEGQTYNGSGIHNATSSPTIETVSLLSIFDNVRVSSRNPQDLRIFLRGGAGGGLLVNTGIVVFAYKKQLRQKRTATRQEKENEK